MVLHEDRPNYPTQESESCTLKSEWTVGIASKLL